ncbi:VOC family protein [Okeania sp. SIO2B3]|uniref:VOC family protein n=1 Tax=Okeania sp. SIO2B3 TaxID=2607784 RepID=UPI00343C7971
MIRGSARKAPYTSIVDDVDAHAEQARKAGAKFVYEPFTHFYGDRVYECIDPEGHRWKFVQQVFDVEMKTLKRPTYLLKRLLWRLFIILVLEFLKPFVPQSPRNIALGIHYLDILHHT